MRTARIRLIALALACLPMAVAPQVASAVTRAEAAVTLPHVQFSNIDGGLHDSADWAGHPVLIINSASMCGYTPQYEAMQDLHEAYADRGLIVLAVPSDDFRQEYDNAEEVRNFCEITFGLTLPMTDITHVRGPDAHPFYQWMQASQNWAPRWNFNKVLIGGDGTVLGTWRSRVEPNDPRILSLIEAELAR